MSLFKELFVYREFLKTSILKEFRGKYKKSFLGVLWSFINPLLQLLVYALVFPFIMRVQVENYTLFLVVALIPWTFFNTTVSQCAGTIISSSGIIKKVYFPRIILPISNVTANLINFFISCIIVVAALFIGGIGIGESIVALPLVILIEYILCLAISFFLSSVTVYIRDLEYFVNVLMMLWFYITPVLYEMTMIPETATIFGLTFNPRGLFGLNPMAHVITAYRQILYYKEIPNMLNLLILLGISLLLLVLGYVVFNKCEKSFAEEL